MLKKIIKKLIPYKYHGDIMLFKDIGFKTYSQEGEDIILSKIFSNQKRGFYVDVGAYHPKKNSTTYKLYKKGWRGINIEPRPISKKLFDLMRKRDINLQMGVYSKKNTLTYYIFTSYPMNTFDKETAKERIDEGITKLIKKEKIPVDTLSNILDKKLPKNISIDYMNIDVEGADFEVLKSNNWIKYKPKIITIEIIGLGIKSTLESKENKFLEEKGYTLVCKLLNTCIYKRKDYPFFWNRKDK
jgi:FkbM family methyltransferase